jgi:hypothetical protein
MWNSVEHLIRKITMPIRRRPIVVRRASSDSRCAMCHWGKAMVLYQQIWQWPSVSDVATGLQEIRLAQRTGTKTPRERAYIAAAADFFQGSARMSHASLQAVDRLTQIGELIDIFIGKRNEREGVKGGCVCVRRIIPMQLRKSCGIRRYPATRLSFLEESRRSPVDP